MKPLMKLTRRDAIIGMKVVVSHPKSRYKATGKIAPVNSFGALFVQSLKKNKNYINNAIFRRGNGDLVARVILDGGGYCLYKLEDLCVTADEHVIKSKLDKINSLLENFKTIGNDNN